MYDVLQAQAPDSFAALDAVARRTALDQFGARLAELKTILGDDLLELEDAIRGLENDDGNVAQRAAAYMLERPGKRLRPICVLLGARFGGRRLDPTLRGLAVAVELVHAATLLHDDVIDVGDERRGAPAARIIYGNAASILAGDHLLVRALELVSRAGAPRLLSDILDVIGEMVSGEAAQLERRGRIDASREQYLRIVRGKTASLFRYSLTAGATLAGVEPERVELLGRLGLALGLAFQLVDDALDIAGDPAVTGKSALTDLREGKMTWPLLIAHERSSEVRDMLAALAGGDGPDPTALAEAVRQTGAVEATLELARDEAAKARELLARMPPSGARRALELVIGLSIERQS